MVHIADPTAALVAGELAGDHGEVDLAEVAITSALTVVAGEGPAEPSGSRTCRGSRSRSARRRAKSARGRGRSSPSVGSDPDYPDVTPRDAEALREWDAAHAQGLTAP